MHICASATGNRSRERIDRSWGAPVTPNRGAFGIRWRCRRPETHTLGNIIFAREVVAAVALVKRYVYKHMFVVKINTAGLGRAGRRGWNFTNPLSGSPLLPLRFPAWDCAIPYPILYLSLRTPTNIPIWKILK